VYPIGAVCRLRRCELEYLTEDRLFSIDIALPAERIAVEVDGPHHFCINVRQAMGDTLSRNRLLKANALPPPFLEQFRLSLSILLSVHSPRFHASVLRLA
jgi:hypothetical protein